jgi:hypothetical protein
VSEGRGSKNQNETLTAQGTGRENPRPLAVLTAYRDYEEKQTGFDL